MPETAPSQQGDLISMVPSNDEKITESVYLSDVSQSDRPWDKNRSFSDAIEAHYRGSVFHRYGERIHECSQLLGFGLTLRDDNSLKLVLKTAKFCRVRYCAVCSWRRSLMWKSKAYKVIPKIVEDYPDHRWLFLTLTVKDPHIGMLRATLKEMSAGFQRMTKLKDFPAVGWLRSMEVTRDRNGDPHPHFHCLLLVPRSYFGRRYLKKSEWAEMWRKSLRVDYTPVMDIRPVKEDESPMSRVPELIKYSTKGSDLIADRTFLIELTRQTHKMRAIATGGVLKQYLHELENEPDDLIQGEDSIDDGILDEYGRLFFGWQGQSQRYRMVKEP
jgi:plasmid rolling circle replication initiator protein Rep